MIYFISGHTDITFEEFKEHYIPRIDDAIISDGEFVVGDSNGTDAIAQQYIGMIVDPQRVTVYFKGDTPKNKVFKGFKECGGFPSHNQKDKAMTLASDRDILYVKREDSGTAENARRRRRVIKKGEQTTLF